jgi:hypothetical protein
MTRAGRPLHVSDLPDGWLDQVLEQIGWTRHRLARELDCDKNLPIRWARGDVGVPKLVVKWLTRLATAHERIPKPIDWKVRNVSR